MYIRQLKRGSYHVRSIWRIHTLGCCIPNHLCVVHLVGSDCSYHLHDHPGCIIRLNKRLVRAGVASVLLRFLCVLESIRTLHTKRKKQVVVSCPLSQRTGVSVAQISAKSFRRNCPNVNADVNLDNCRCVQVRDVNTVQNILKRGSA